MSLKDFNAKRPACQGAERLSPTVILVRPREEGNVGMAARAMANMGLSKLILVEPAAELGGIARGFGVGGWHLLDGARRAASLDEAVAPFHRVVGTASLRDRSPGRTPVISPRELADVLAADPPETRTALVFGPEDTGLTRAELEITSPVVHIPVNAERPTLNLAQAVLVVAYELHLGSAGTVSGQTEPPARQEEFEGLLTAAAELLDRVGFDQPHIRQALLSDARRLSRRSGASSHEIRVLWRVVNRILDRLPEPPLV